MTAQPSSRTQQRQALLDLLSPVVASQGYDLEDLTVSAAGRKSVIRVMVDSDHGIDLDAVAQVSRAVSEVLDGDLNSSLPRLVFTGAYVLEVSSPGLDRPLTEPRHWRRAKGRMVTVKIGDSNLTERIIAVDGEDLILEVGGSQRSFPLSSVGVGRLQVEFSRKGEPDFTDTDEHDNDSHQDEEA